MVWICWQPFSMKTSSLKTRTPVNHILSMLPQLISFFPLCPHPWSHPPPPPPPTTPPIPLIAHQRAVLLELLKSNLDVCWEEPLALQTAQQTQMPLFG